MRFFLNLFKKKSKSFEEQLECVKEEIKEIEEKRKLNLSNEKHLIGSLMLYSFMLYFTCTAFIFLYVKPSQTNYWPIYFAPLVAFPFLIFYIKKVIHWFYVRRLNYVDNKLTDLKKQLKELLKAVIENETYKRANEILNKFDSNFEFRNEYEDFPDRKHFQASSQRNSDSELDKKNILPGSVKSKSKLISSSAKTVSVCDLSNREKFAEPKPNLAALTTDIKLIRPLLNQNRSNFDKVIDFIVGDGFNQRYALICRHCSSHNGMALAEEFPFIAFKCAYCRGFNSARQTKPDPPTIYDNVPVPATVPVPVTEEAQQIKQSETETEMRQRSINSGDRKDD